MRKISALVLATLLGLSSVSADRPNDLVTALPDCGSTLPSKWYSGYLNVGDSKSLHYVFVESISDKAA